MRIEEFFQLYATLIPNLKGCKFIPRKTSSHGYAILRISGRIVRCNRIILERKLGRPIKPGLLALHTCDNRACVAEEHIYEGTHAQNTQDAIDRKRMKSGENHWTRKHPERVCRGSSHPFTKNPKLAAHGQSNGMVKLTQEQVCEILELYVNKKISSTELAARFKTSKSVVQRIARGTHWGTRK